MTIERIAIRTSSERVISKELTVSTEHIIKTAHIIHSGGIAAFPFNGVWGLFGNADDPEAVDKILEIKERDPKKGLVLVAAPDHIHEHVDFSKIRFPKKAIIEVWKDIHALGMVLPASEDAPKRLVWAEKGQTILNIWTEYQPLKLITCELRKLGVRAMVGTSANISGEATINTFDRLREVFKELVDVLVIDDFSNLSEIRRRSTSIVDMTGEVVRLHRRGNTSEEEIAKLLEKHGLGRLIVPDEVREVKHN